MKLEYPLKVPSSVESEIRRKTIKKNKNRESHHYITGEEEREGERESQLAGHLCSLPFSGYIFQFISKQLVK